MIQGIMSIVLGALSFFWAEREARQIADRMDRGDDRFFEEQRAYRAYPFLRDPKHYRRVGVVLVIGGILICVLSLGGN